MSNRSMMKKIVFLTGTRADFGKLKPLIAAIEASPAFECHVFVTGMHLLPHYGDTYIEVQKERYENIHLCKNQDEHTDMDLIMSNTIAGLSHYLKALEPDMLVIHGDRVEAMAGAIVGALSNILVAHIEGGEVSGTIDELIRHAVTKMSHLHFVANETARRRVAQLGELEESIFVIGSPDLDIMTSEHLPDLQTAKTRYDIAFDDYAIFCYHPVTTELKALEANIEAVLAAVVESERNYIAIYPNNDPGSRIIIDRLLPLQENPRFRILPSMRFEHFLVLMKSASFVIGNSSAGVREAGFYSVPSIDIGSRQRNRYSGDGVLHAREERTELRDCLLRVGDLVVEQSLNFGDGRSAERFMETINGQRVWDTPRQKQFVDIFKS